MIPKPLARSLPLALPLSLLAAPAFASGGDIASLSFVASAPESYDHALGGGAYDDGTVGVAADVVSSLQGGDFTCGDIVSYLTRIRVDAAPVDPVQTLRTTFAFSADSTGQSGVGHVSLVGARANYGSVSGGDGPNATDAAIADDGGSLATIVSWEFTGGASPFTSGTDLTAVIDIDDLEAGEDVILRLDVRIECLFGSSPTGNLQASLSSAEVVAPSVDTVSGGAQTIPFQKVGEVIGARGPALWVNRTAALTSGSCPGVNSIAASPGETLQHCYSLDNEGAGPAYDVQLVDDAGTPGDPSDDRTIAIGGLEDLDGDGSFDDLGASAFVVDSWALPSQESTWTMSATLSGHDGTAKQNPTVATDAIEISTMPLEPSSGGDGGLESNGRLASALARRAVWRRIQRAWGLPDLRPRLATPLDDLLPPGGVDVTPVDLVDLTNATAVAARDYVDAEGRRFASALLVETEATHYEHAKAICDRAKGATLDAIEPTTIGGQPAIRSTFTDPLSGVRDHAVSVRVARGAGGSSAAGTPWLAEHAPDVAADGRGLSIDVWARTPESAEALASTILDAALGNAATWTRAEAPAVYLRSASVLGRDLTVDVSGDARTVHDASLRAIVLEDDGRTESVVDLGRVTLGSSSRVIPPALDATIEILSAGEVIDRVWLSDGAWTPFTDSPEIRDAFSREDCRRFDDDARAAGRAAIDLRSRPEVELVGCARHRGTVRRFGGVARHLAGGAARLDLTEFGSLTAWVRSDRAIEVCLHSDGQGTLVADCAPHPAQEDGGWIGIDLTELDPDALASVYLVTFGVHDAEVDIEVSGLAFGTERVPMPHGCACRTGSPVGDGSGWLLGLVALAASRRRRQRPPSE